MGSRRDLAAVAIVACLAACGSPRVSEQKTAPVVPAVTLANGLEPLAFAPGRYATAIQRTLEGTHAVQMLTEDTTAFLSLELADGGKATACRGWRTIARNDGPEVHTEDNYREQQGYRGTYTVDAGIAKVTLAADDTVCPHIFEGALALQRAKQLALTCVLARAQTVEYLLCRPEGAMPEELAPHVVDQIAAGGWIALGAGTGVRVWVTGKPTGAMVGDETAVTTKAADAPLGIESWTKSF